MQTRLGWGRTDRTFRKTENALGRENGRVRLTEQVSPRGGLGEGWEEGKERE